MLQFFYASYRNILMESQHSSHSRQYGAVTATQKDPPAHAQCPKYNCQTDMRPLYPCMPDIPYDQSAPKYFLSPCLIS